MRWITQSCPLRDHSDNRKSRGRITFLDAAGGLSRGFSLIVFICFLLSLTGSEIFGQSSGQQGNVTKSNRSEIRGQRSSNMGERLGGESNLEATGIEIPDEDQKADQIVKRVEAQANEGNNVGLTGALDPNEIPTATWVSLDEFGGFTARIFDLGDQAEFRLQTAGVVFLTEVTGDFKFERLDASGKITFKDVEPGVHMITFIAPGRFLVSAVHAVASSPSPDQLFPTKIDLWCVNYGKREVDAILLPFLTKGTAGLRPEVDPRKVEAISEIGKRRRIGSNAIQDVQYIPTVFLINGGLTGTVYRPGTSNQTGQLLDPLDDADILLVGEDDVYLRIRTNKQGRFRFESIKPGAYALLCTSDGGIAAIGMVVLDPNADKPVEAAKLTGASSYRFVSQGGGGGGLALQTSPNVSLLSLSTADAAATESGARWSLSAGQSAASASSATTLSEIASQSEIPSVTNNTAEADTDPDINSNAAPPQ